MEMCPADRDSYSSDGNSVAVTPTYRDATGCSVSQALMSFMTCGSMPR